MDAILDRFLRYVAFPTTSVEGAACWPSSPGQRDLGAALAAELSALGLDPVRHDENGYVYARLPATPGRENDECLGFIAHLDTAPDFPGAPVRPQVVRNYDGGAVALRGSGATLRPEDFPDLAGLKGRTLITTDGTTLLGADDKAGIAAIMTALATLQKERAPHGDVWVAFTPDEEIGRGAERFDLARFPASWAYTVDGGAEGGLAYENFNAATARFVVKGRSVHPGAAKGVMVNAARVAATLAARLPAAEAPEHTEGREGFFHLTEIKGGVEAAEFSVLIRDHDGERFAARKELLRRLAGAAEIEHGPGVVRLEIGDSYANMGEVMKRHPEVLERARAAIRAAGLEPISKPVRGGTDGARLSFMGLPCPNLGTGGHAFHGPFEHVTVEGMATAARIIVNVATGAGDNAAPANAPAPGAPRGAE